MAKAKPRGSVNGLLRFRQEVKDANTRSLISSVGDLKLSKPFQNWTYAEVCRLAGLKSVNALNAPWNGHVRDEIDRHNAELQTELEEDKVAARTSKSLREELRLCREQRDAALSKIAVYEADARFYKRKYQAAQRVLDRIRNSSNG